MSNITNNPTMNLLLISALVEKLGGSVTLTQDDVDYVAYTTLHEDAIEGQITLTVMRHEAVQ